MVPLSASLYANRSFFFGLVEPTVEPESLPALSVVTSNAFLEFDPEGDLLRRHRGLRNEG